MELDLYHHEVSITVSKDDKAWIAMHGLPLKAFVLNVAECPPQLRGAIQAVDNIDDNSGVVVVFGETDDYKTAANP